MYDSLRQYGSPGAAQPGSRQEAERQAVQQSSGGWGGQATRGGGRFGGEWGQNVGGECGGGLARLAAFGPDRSGSAPSPCRPHGLYFLTPRKNSFSLCLHDV